MKGEINIEKEIEKGRNWQEKNGVNKDRKKKINQAVKALKTERLMTPELHIVPIPRFRL